MVTSLLSFLAITFNLFHVPVCTREGQSISFIQSLCMYHHAFTLANSLRILRVMKLDTICCELAELCRCLELCWFEQAALKDQEFASV